MHAIVPFRIYFMWRYLEKQTDKWLVDKPQRKTVLRSFGAVRQDNVAYIWT